VKSFEQFYQEFRGRFFAYLLRLTREPDLAGEIMQESFTRYLESYGDRPCEPRLLYTIGRNAALDTFRRRRRADAVDVETPDPEGDQEQRLVVKQNCRHLEQALDLLAPGERDMLLLAASGDLTYREIAEIAGISESNVKVRVHRARVKLRNLMKKVDHDGRTAKPVYR
jgi:RNA polymerase sigma-70 factor (ECF subfamily)